MKWSRSTYQYSTDIFLRSLGVVYFLAIYSLWSQIDGLIGQRGILPADHFFEQARLQLGDKAPWVLPSLLWWSSSNEALHLLCWLGMGFSMLLVLGVVPLLCTSFLWLIYLSLVVAGQTFLAFQWDNLLLESGLLAIFLAPAVWRSRPASNPPASRFVVFLLHWLLFRLMFSSGYVKLASGDESWWNLTALNYHFWTQPLPVWISWYAHQLPVWMLKASVLIMFVIELIIPFFIFLNRPLRYAAFFLFLLFQVLLVITGNYGFFNILTVVLALLLLDDRIYLARESEPPPASRHWFPRCWKWVRWPICTVLLIISVFTFAAQFRLPVQWPASLVSLHQTLAPLRSVNHYGLFASMTKSRNEIILEGSLDGLNWLPYEFYYKPGDVYRTPVFAVMYMPRFDWQMWFAALGSYQGNPWLLNAMSRLLEGEPDVLDLLEINPFPLEPPTLIRAVVYEYTFASREQNATSYLWWNRELKGLYCPILKRSP